MLVAVIEALAARGRSREKKRIEETKAGLERGAAAITGVQTLLRNEIIAKYNRYTEQGYIPIYGMENVLNMYNAYRVLGGNGTVVKLVESLKTLPTEPPEQEGT